MSDENLFTRCQVLGTGYWVLGTRRYKYKVPSTMYNCTYIHMYILYILHIMYISYTP